MIKIILKKIELVTITYKLKLKDIDLIVNFTIKSISFFIKLSIIKLIKWGYKYYELYDLVHNIEKYEI